MKVHGHDNSVPDKERPIVQLPKVRIYYAKAIVKNAAVHTVGLIICKATHANEVLWWASTRCSKSTPYRKCFRQNCFVVMEKQAAHNFPRHTYYPVAVLTLYDHSWREMQTTGSRFKLAKDFLC